MTQQRGLRRFTIIGGTIGERIFDEQFDYGLRVLFTGMKMAE
jgi:hypothetical protein